MDELQNQAMVSMHPIDNVHHAQHMTLSQHKHYFNKCWFHIGATGGLCGTFLTHNLKNCPDNCWRSIVNHSTLVLNFKPLQRSRVIFLRLLKRLQTPPRVKSQFSCGFLKDFKPLQESRVIFLSLLKTFVYVGSGTKCSIQLVPHFGAVFITTCYYYEFIFGGLFTKHEGLGWQVMSFSCRYHWKRG